MAEPDFYFDYTAESIDDYERDIFDLLQLVIKKFRDASFKTSKFKFIPEQEGYKTEWTSAQGIWELPEALKKGNNGFVPMVIR